MKKFLCLPYLLAAIVGSFSAQAQKAPSPYHTRFATDGPITLGLTGVNVAGLLLIRAKTGISPEAAVALKKSDVPFFDRFSAGYYDEGYRTVSDYTLIGSLIGSPAIMALDPSIRGRAGQIAGLYVQTMVATGAIFTMAAGTVYRQRPLTYSSTASITERTRQNATNSFFAGHTAYSAAATFFAAKVFHDFHPDSPAQPYVWAAAALVPAAVGYCRIEAGKHFLSDNLLGYAVGATLGVAVPQLHRTAAGAGMTVLPMQGINTNGYAYGGLLLSKQL
ncbi:phosphatase PAP2 family protein [Hymenobacter sp. BT770]|uniref:phosphatase PAP2 family protein n=1 Tax=Hymenobacter sp. BT770 TaxID=2886942 RepID=UPI0026730AEB|nr:phosphatase PAP2 family protein [Hymenobacter sp. BT770]MCC3152011.1 phosphatase PAP2 family protein [Hymenobacter sp. BT770]MDO3415306.1 phosphatase PAP2 family protein [Hymenobacter sp. BT770]